MAKGLHYFKFIASEWLVGNITFEPFEVQGLYINICALYWQRDGKLAISEIEQRYKKKSIIAKLNGRFFSVNEGFISIGFLDEQLIERQHTSKTNSDNGKKGGRPHKKKNKAKKSQLELEVEIESEEEIKKKTLLSEILISEVTNQEIKIIKNFWELFSGERKKGMELKHKGLLKAYQEKWLSDLNAMLNNDKRSVDDIRAIYSFIKNEKSKFWVTTIESMSGLREHFDKIQDSMIKQGIKTQKAKETTVYQGSIEDKIKKQNESE